MDVSPMTNGLTFSTSIFQTFLSFTLFFPQMQLVFRSSLFFVMLCMLMRSEANIVNGSSQKDRFDYILRFLSTLLGLHPKESKGS